MAERGTDRDERREAPPERSGAETGRRGAQLYEDLIRPDFERSFGGRGEDFGVDLQRWLDLRADRRLREGPYRGRGPRGWTRSDELLFEAVSEHLAADRLLDARGVSVEVEDAVVTLNGHVRAPSDRVLAEMLARETPGVAEVRNGLEVRHTAISAPRAFRPRSGLQRASLGDQDRAEGERRPGPPRVPPFCT